MSRILPRFDYRVDVAADTVTGPVRSRNEDAILVAPELALFGVADGMGGLEHGEIASRVALEAARAHVAAKSAISVVEAYVAQPSLERRRRMLDLLRGAAEAAHKAVVAEQATRGAPMGSTLDLCLFARDKAFLAHVGDGRAYLARATTTLQITEDHLVHDPLSTRLPRDGRRPPRPLASGVGLAVPLRVDVFPLDLVRGDTVLLTTDGAYGALDDESRAHRLCRNGPKQIVEELVTRAVERGGRDNASVVAIRVHERLVARPGAERHDADDRTTAHQSPLFQGLSLPHLYAALASGIEVELPEGARLEPSDAGDLCAYVVLEGLVELDDGRVLGPPAVLWGESLVGVRREPRGEGEVRAASRFVRIRRDDFREVATHDPQLGAALYERLAHHLGRTL